jgi:hypothetical protein
VKDKDEEEREEEGKEEQARKKKEIKKEATFLIFFLALCLFGFATGSDSPSRHRLLVGGRIRGFGGQQQ